MTAFTVTEDFPKSEIEFDQRFRDIDACYNYLASIKWPSGFMCDEYGHKNHWFSSQYIYICTRCEHQHSLTAGTIMHGTKKPITYWFKAMWWFTTRKSCVSAVNLQEWARPWQLPHRMGLAAKAAMLHHLQGSQKAIRPC